MSLVSKQDLYENDDRSQLTVIVVGAFWDGPRPRCHDIFWTVSFAKLYHSIGSQIQFGCACLTVLEFFQLVVFCSTTPAF
jgi:hypothetical protein